MQAQHVYLVYKNIYQQILFPVFFGYSWTFSWCAQITIHSASKKLIVGMEKLFTDHHCMWHLSAWSPTCCFIMIIVLQDVPITPQEVFKPTTLTNLESLENCSLHYVFQTTARCVAQGPLWDQALQVPELWCPAKHSIWQGVLQAQWPGMLHNLFGPFQIKLFYASWPPRTC